MGLSDVLNGMKNGSWGSRFAKFVRRHVASHHGTSRIPRQQKGDRGDGVGSFLSGGLSGLLNDTIRDPGNPRLPGPGPMV